MISPDIIAATKDKEPLDKNLAVLAVEIDSPMGQGLKQILPGVTTDTLDRVCEEFTTGGPAAEILYDGTYDFTFDASSLITDAFSRALGVNLKLVRDYLSKLDTYVSETEERPRAPSSLEAVEIIEVGYDDVLRTDFFTAIINEAELGHGNNKPPFNPNMMALLPTETSALTTNSIPWLDEYMEAVVNGGLSDIPVWLEANLRGGSRYDLLVRNQDGLVRDPFINTLSMIVFWRKCRLSMDVENEYDRELYRYISDNFKYWTRVLHLLTRSYEDKVSKGWIFDPVQTDNRFTEGGVGVSAGEEKAIVVVHKHLMNDLRKDNYFYDVIVGYLFSKNPDLYITVDELKNGALEYSRTQASEDKVRDQRNYQAVASENRHSVVKAFSELRKSLTEDVLVENGIDSETIGKLDLLNVTDRQLTDSVMNFITEIPTGSDRSIVSVAIYLVCRYILKDESALQILLSLICVDEDGEEYISEEPETLSKAITDFTLNIVMTQFTHIEK